MTKEEFFLNRYKNKTKRELEHILANRSIYEPEAISAAETTIKEESYQVEEILMQVKPVKSKTLKDSWLMFRRALSMRDVYILVTLVAALKALMYAYIYSKLLLRTEVWEYVYLFMAMASFIIANHYLYYLVHQRANTFVGRVIMDFTFFIGFFILEFGFSMVYLVYYGYFILGTSISFIEMTLGLVAFIFVFIIFEVLLELLKLIFRFRFI
ncbi:hypothetical protein LVD15_08175 [Fulvivirga maritima]|uniref:hypothetical protein n=1 Tax=Fulvivirga maritima TaxID=2904247 RepID=UPI001F32B824|nr:hypothetical protein [Fulvivirga maritima]UII28392.1 hypothetical protein LVD15_08175 [Fulvivirga maritima]